MGRLGRSTMGVGRGRVSTIGPIDSMRVVTSKDRTSHSTEKQRTNKSQRWSDDRERRIRAMNTPSVPIKLLCFVRAKDQVNILGGTIRSLEYGLVVSLGCPQTCLYTKVQVNLNRTTPHERHIQQPFPKKD